MLFNFTSEDVISDVEDICRCLTNILSIPRGTLPLARDMGVSWANLSQIPSELENDFATEVIEKVEKYEPRVFVREVTFSFDKNGMAAVNIMLERGDMDG